MNEKHILIIDGFPPPHRWLLERNYKVTWLTSVEQLGDRKGYFRKVGLPNDASEEEWVLTSQVIHSLDPFTIIVNFKEDKQKITSIIAEALGLQWNTINIVEQINNKYLMRNRINHISPIHFAKAKSKTEITDKLNLWGPPLIIKPLDSSGSTGIYRVNNLEDVELAWSSIQKLGFSEILIEEMIEGKEYSVETYTQNGQHHILAVTEKYKSFDSFIEVGHVVPAGINENEIENLYQYVSQILTTLGVMEGITHTEVILNEDTPVVVETHLRMGGDYIPTLVEEALGIDMLNIWLERTVNYKEYINKELSPIQSRYAAIWFKMSDVKGRVSEINNISEVENMQNVILVQALKKVGDEIVPTYNSQSRLCFVIAHGHTKEEALNNAQKGIEKIEYIVN